MSIGNVGKGTGPDGVVIWQVVGDMTVLYLPSIHPPTVTFFCKVAVDMSYGPGGNIPAGCMAIAPPIIDGHIVFTIGAATTLPPKDCTVNASDVFVKENAVNINNPNKKSSTYFMVKL